MDSRFLLVVRRMSDSDVVCRGSRCYFPVFIKGANLSVGDLHFSQGDVSPFFMIRFPVILMNHAQGEVWGL